MDRRRLVLRASLAGLVTLAGLGGCQRDARWPPLPADAAVLAFGDSLTAGTGAEPAAAWPALLAQRTGWRIRNEGLPGDTAESGLARLQAVLDEARFDAVLLGLGGNDMLRGRPDASVRSDLEALARLARGHTPHVALIATPRPSLAGALAGLQDADFYGAVAEATGAALVPDAYARALSSPELRSDRIHANEAGYALIAQAVGDRLAELGWAPR